MVPDGAFRVRHTSAIAPAGWTAQDLVVHWRLPIGTLPIHDRICVVNHWLLHLHLHALDRKRQPARVANSAAGAE